MSTEVTAGTLGEPLKDDLRQTTHVVLKLHALCEHLLHFYLLLSLQTMFFLGFL